MAVKEKPFIIDVLQKCELFNTLTPKELELVLPLCSIKTYPAGGFIFVQGERLQALYVVVQGTVSIRRKTRGAKTEGGMEITLNILVPGKLLGWMSLIDPYIAMASAYAMKDTQVIAVDCQGLRHLLESNQPMGNTVMNRLATLLARVLRDAYSIVDVSL